MIDLKPSVQSEQCALNFLENNPSISKSLMAELDHDLDQVSTIVEPILNARKRCGVTVYYIQAVTTGKTAFLTTNLPEVQETFVTDIASNWLLGRSLNCAIAVPHTSISRCHAVVGHCPNNGFYIMDVGSCNGTFVNRRRLPALERRVLQDGDLISLSSLQVEFFVVSSKNQPTTSVDATLV